MATVEQLNQWVDDFERCYPETYAGRLEWFVQELGVDPYRLLRLMGFTRQQAEELIAKGLDWNWIAEKYEDEALWAEERIHFLIKRFRYDWRAMAKELNQPESEEFVVNLPGGHTMPISQMPSDEREKALLYVIAESGRWNLALLAYLSQPPAAFRHA